jgi:SAM-dependent methyltransferase
VPEAPTADTALSFGPARCESCGARFPVHEGLIDFAADRQGPRIAQQLMERPWLARSWERYVRPALDTVLSLGKLDRDGEYAAVRGFLAAPAGPLVDLGCGSGTHLRRFALELGALGVIGVDLSKPMLEEAIAQVREAGVAVDFVRASVPPLPFVDRSLGAIVATGFMHFVSDFDALLIEAARVLAPGGRLVASTFESSGILRPVHQQAGLFPRDEAVIRAAAQRAGFVNFERVRVAPFITWKVELP